MERKYQWYGLNPQLSEGAIKRMRGMGLEPDEMSEEQLEAIESLDNPEKNHWLVKPFNYIGGFLVIIALFSLFSAAWGAVIVFGVIGLILSYIGYRIQIRIASKKFFQASLKKDMEERNPEAGKLWNRFKGMVNTDEVLIEKAKALAPLLVDLISEYTKSLFEELKKEKERKIDDEKIGEVFFEMALFNRHYVDRIAFQYLGAEKRNVFMDALVIGFGDDLLGHNEIGIDGKCMMHRSHYLPHDLLGHNESSIDVAQFRYSITETYRERQQEYAKYKRSVPEKNVSAKDTLFWEFGKKTAGILGLEMDAFVIMRIYMQTFTKYKFLELPELFSEKK